MPNQRFIHKLRSPDSDAGQEDESQSVRDKMELYLKEGLSMGKHKLLKGKVKLEHSLGLGHKPNVIPSSEPDNTGEHRTVEIGWHPVAGFAGKWFAEKTGLGKMMTEKLHKCPDPTQHWAVLVGSYVHQLWMDENLDVIYINEEINREEWHVYEVGKTRFNDEALRQAGNMVIYNMRVKDPAYHLIRNNCQTFALLMLEAIQVGGHKQFTTSYTVYQRALGEGRIRDLFVSNLPEEDEDAKPPNHSIVQHAQELMERYTTKLDKHHSTI